MQRHHNPKPSVILQRFRFNTCLRKQGQSVATFVAELRHLTEHCEFGDSMDEMLRGWLVCGINGSRLQRRLLTEPGLTFQKALELARAFESTEKNARDLQTVREAERSVNAVRTKQEDACYCCGGTHAAVDCRFKNVDCHSCRKRGHLTRMCRRSGGNKDSQTQQELRNQAHWLEDDSESIAAEYGLF